MLTRSMCVLVLLVAPITASGDVVMQWNAAFRQAAQENSTKSDPGWASRTLAMMNGAIYDAFQAIDRTHQPFRVNMAAPPETSFPAAASQAAHRVLTLAYPDQAGLFDAHLTKSLGGIHDGTARSRGIELGDKIADAYITWREGDGATGHFQYMPESDHGHWRPDPMNPSQEAWGPGWGMVEPFALESATQFTVPPPPALDTREYAESLHEVQEVGARNSATRTADQTEMALFWAYDRVNMGPPPILFNSAVSQIAEQQGNSAEENARLFAMTSVALADAGIASWDSKYRYDLWRPISAIRDADSDGNPLTEADPDWVPLGAPGGGMVPDFTPPFPSYVSGHGTFAEATFRSLTHFYGTDDIPFLLTSDELPGVVRAFDSFSAASDEVGRSRVYMGVHFDFDSIEAQVLGRQVADWVHANHFRAIPEPSSVALAATVAVLAGLPCWRRRR